MPTALSIDLRKRIIAEYEKGAKTQEEVAAQFHVGVASVVRLVALKRNTGGLAPKKQVGGVHRRTIDAAGEVAVLELLEEDPELTILELTERFIERTGRPTSTSSMSRALQRMRITRKKRR